MWMWPSFLFIVTLGIIDDHVTIMYSRAFLAMRTGFS